MTKRKIERFAELNTFENVFHPKLEYYVEGGFPFKGSWAKDFFKNNNPIVLELGCGKGEYTTGLAEKYPEKNFIGVDLKGERIWKGSKTAIDKGMKNVAFIRTQIERIEYFFEKDEVSEIWITFPDPQLNKPRIKKRLTSPAFLERYKKFIKPEGIIHLKTDNAIFFEYSLNIIHENNHTLLFTTHDLYGSELTDDILGIKTFYEQKFMEKGFKICYLKFKLST
ncbi:MAG: tRNA (guanosine(46)-N7)-methyltransferase TrmB [Bacteroidetes bacterium]|nr:tRNA (guanosine(46)-N7)-methyltransferase TrmB [Bacteroidota bacterium]